MIYYIINRSIIELGENMKYYEAYDKRYKQVHDKGLSWTTMANTKVVEDVINKYCLENGRILEIGCGEGRDSKYLLNKGYNVLVTDVSIEAMMCAIKEFLDD